MNDLPKSNGNTDEKSTKPNRSRRIRATMLVICGTLTLMFSGTLTDYANGISTLDGIYIPDATHQFAKDEAMDGVYSHTFRIYNLRPRVLQVEAQPDCGCTGVSWNKTTILPYGWKDVTARMRASKANLGSSTSIGFQSDSKIQPWVFAFLKN